LKQAHGVHGGKGRTLTALTAEHSGTQRKEDYNLREHRDHREKNIFI